MKITQKQIMEHIEKLGLRSCGIHNVSEVAAVLSQPRAALVVMRAQALKRGDVSAVEACDAGISTLTDIIGDNFKPGGELGKN
jgi:hypothetical protein